MICGLATVHEPSSSRVVLNTGGKIGVTIGVVAAAIVAALIAGLLLYRRRQNRIKVKSDFLLERLITKRQSVKTAMGNVTALHSKNPVLLCKDITSMQASDCLTTLQAELRRQSLKSAFTV